MTGGCPRPCYVSGHDAVRSDAQNGSVCRAWKERLDQRSASWLTCRRWRWAGLNSRDWHVMWVTGHWKSVRHRFLGSVGPAPWQSSAAWRQLWKHFGACMCVFSCVCIRESVCVCVNMYGFFFISRLCWPGQPCRAPPTHTHTHTHTTGDYRFSNKWGPLFLVILESEEVAKRWLESLSF